MRAALVSIQHRLEFTSVHIVEFVGTAQRAVNANVNDAYNLFVKTMNLEQFKPTHSDKKKS